MNSETIQLAGSLDQATAMNVAQALNAVKGVNKVAMSTADARVTIDFNEHATSLQELSSVLQRAGFIVKKAARHSSGSCCGSCGG